MNFIISNLYNDNGSVTIFLRLWEVTSFYLNVFKRNDYLKVLNIKFSSHNICVTTFYWSIWASITKYHRPGALNNRYFPQFWRLGIQDQDACKTGFILKSLLLTSRGLQSPCVLSWPPLRTEKTSYLVSLLIKTLISTWQLSFMT